MATNSDISFAKNVTNFEALISIVTSFGAAYNPSKDSLKIPALKSLHLEATDSMAALKMQNQPHQLPLILGSLHLNQ